MTQGIEGGLGAIGHAYSFVQLLIFGAGKTYSRVARPAPQNILHAWCE
jgi:hypothetical protein